MRQSFAHMTETPVNATPEGIHAEPRKTGHRIVDYAIAGSAILISLISLGVAIHHGHAQERLVAANSWPFLAYGVSNSTDVRGQHMRFLIRNGGVGPAVLKSLVVRYQGKPVRGWVELLQQCCDMKGEVNLQNFLRQGVSGDDHPVGVILAQNEVLILELTRREEGVALWEKLDAARRDLAFDACY